MLNRILILGCNEITRYFGVMKLHVILCNETICA